MVKTRSRVTNGKAPWLDASAVDGRSKVARRFKDVLNEITGDLGGADRLSEGQRQIARRVAMLSVQCELLEAQAVAGGEFDIERYGMMTDRLGRAFQRLGLHRVARDVTPSLDDILRQHRDAEAARSAESAQGRDTPAVSVSRAGDARQRPANAIPNEGEGA
jgi:hypothetical protein